MIAYVILSEDKKIEKVFINKKEALEFLENGSGYNHRIDEYEIVDEKIECECAGRDPVEYIREIEKLSKMVEDMKQIIILLSKNL